MKSIYARYRQASRAEKQLILSEFCRVCGYHRKHAIRKLNGPAPSDKPANPHWGTLLDVKRSASHLFLRYAFP